MIEEDDKRKKYAVKNKLVKTRKNNDDRSKKINQTGLIAVSLLMVLND